jgi:hypothetical protein
MPLQAIACIASEHCHGEAGVMHMMLTALLPLLLHWLGLGLLISRPVLCSGHEAAPYSTWFSLQCMVCVQLMACLHTCMACTDVDDKACCLHLYITVCVVVSLYHRGRIILGRRRHIPASSDVSVVPSYLIRPHLPFSSTSCQLCERSSVVFYPLPAAEIDRLKPFQWKGAGSKQNAFCLLSQQ